MFKVTVISVGRVKEAHWLAAGDEYQKRLTGAVELRFVELSAAPLPQDPSAAAIAAALGDEGRRILAAVPPRAALCCLCVEGQLLTSEQLAGEIEGIKGRGRSGMAFVIGSSHGLSPEVKARADLKLSLSRMTFPHGLARVMLLEQIYRAAEIAKGTGYHK